MNREMTLAVNFTPLYIGDSSTVADIMKELNERISGLFPLHLDGGFGLSFGIDREQTWFKLCERWTVVFMVEGGSEGHYIHINTMSGYSMEPGTNRSIGQALAIASAKTFGGFEQAQDIVRATQFLLTDGHG